MTVEIDEELLLQRDGPVFAQEIRLVLDAVADEAGRRLISGETHFRFLARSPLMADPIGTVKTYRDRKEFEGELIAEAEEEKARFRKEQ